MESFWSVITRFAKEFEKEPQRGYGGNIPVVFKALLDPDLTDVFLPASQQFDGRGSYGNGGAMRIAPAPLFTFVNNDISKLMVCFIFVLLNFSLEMQF